MASKIAQNIWLDTSGGVIIADIINIATIIVFLCFVNCLSEIISNFIKANNIIGIWNTRQNANINPKKAVRYSLILNIGFATLFVCDRKKLIARGNIQLYIVVIASITRMIDVKNVNTAIFFSFLYKLDDKNFYMQYKNTGNDIKKDEYRHNLISAKNISQIPVKINILSVDILCDM